MQTALKVELDLPALVEFKFGTSPRKNETVALVVGGTKVSRAEGLGRQTLKLQALANWMRVQFPDELIRLAPRAYTVFTYPSEDSTADLSKATTGQGDLKALIAHYAGRIFRVDVNTSVAVEDWRDLLKELGIRWKFLKYASKEKIEYYLLEKFE